MDALNDFYQDSNILLKWFKENLLKVDTKNYHLHFITDENNALEIGKIPISNSKWEKLIRIN